MVFFTCDGCGEALKKNQVEKHKFRCRSQTYSCIDCNAVFTSDNYKDHIKCITEDQKYGGKNFVQKECKGEAKQNQWVEQVERAIANVSEPNVKSVLEQILGFGNIPRKEAKFINFLQNSIRIRDRNLCVKAWKCIAEEADKMRLEAQKAKEAEKDSASVAASANEEHKSEKPDKEVKDENENEEEAASNGEALNGDAKKFKWKKAIKRKLQSVDGGAMKMKKLRTAIMEKYREEGHQKVDDAHFKQMFADKVISSGAIVDGNVVRLAQ